MVMLKKNGGFSLATNAKLLGTGEKTLVLSHGYGGDQSMWDKIVPPMAQVHQVLVFDWNLSGDGEGQPNFFDFSLYSSLDSFADALISLVESLNLKRFVYVGHSMSGIIGCMASIKRPDLFERLILLGASPRYLNAEGYEGGFERSQVDSIISSIELNFQSWAVAFASTVVDVKDSISADQFRRCLMKMRPDIALSLAKTIFLSDHREILDRVEVPCTIIQTSRDIVVPMSVPYYMQMKIKGKPAVEIIEGEGHFPQLTAHESLIKVLDEVLGADQHLHAII